jgi:hypothetical protein
LLDDGEAFAGALESFAVFVAPGIADDLAFESFDGVLQMLDNLAHDSD